MAEISVVTWGTREPLPNDAMAPMHDSLWEIALEQAVLDRMGRTGEDWETAHAAVSAQDIITHLDTICDDNGFRRLYGGGQGRDPNLIYPDEVIEVRIDPAELDNPAAGVTEGAESQAAYNEAVFNDAGTGVDLTRKRDVDAWLETIPEFQQFPESTKAGLLTAYTTEGVDREALATLAGTEAFTALDATDQEQLLSRYGTEGHHAATEEVDRIAAEEPSDENNRLMRLVASPGFFELRHTAYAELLGRYQDDQAFRAAIDQILGREDFRTRSDGEQAHALDILWRYAGREGEGYGEIDEGRRTDVLIALYDEVLMTPDFHLGQAGESTYETGAQTEAIGEFAENRAGEVADEGEEDED